MDDYSKCDFKEYNDIVKETDKAWLIDLVNEKERWFPKSICELDKGAQLLIIPIWLSKKIWGNNLRKRPPAYLDACPRVEDDSFYDPYEFH